MSNVPTLNADASLESKVAATVEPGAVAPPVGTNDAGEQSSPNSSPDSQYSPEVATLVEQALARSHPVANLFPMVSEAELRGMAENIKEVGLTRAVVMLDGRILDGRNREVACKLAGVSCRYKDFKDMKTDATPERWAVAENLVRRHLNESQRAMLGAQLEVFYASAAKGRQRLDNESRSQLPESQKGQARDHAARDVKVSPRSIQNAKKVLAKGTPELVSAVQSGEAKVSAAAVIAELPKKQQQKVVSSGAAAIRSAIKKTQTKKEPARAEAQTKSDTALAIQPSPDTHLPRHRLQVIEDRVFLNVLAPLGRSEFSEIIGTMEELDRLLVGGSFRIDVAVVKNLDADTPEPNERAYSLQDAYKFLLAQRRHALAAVYPQRREVTAFAFAYRTDASYELPIPDDFEFKRDILEAPSLDLEKVGERFEGRVIYAAHDDKGRGIVRTRILDQFRDYFHRFRVVETDRGVGGEGKA